MTATGGGRATRLMRATEVSQRPVVTYAGEDVAQVKDVIYTGTGGVAGFTLAGRGLFAGPSDRALRWSAVASLGRDAVMITADSVLEPLASVLSGPPSSAATDASATEPASAPAKTAPAGAGGDVMGSQVLTDGGTDLGRVTDVVLEVGPGQCDVVGYEIEATAALGTQGTRLLIPLPATLAASGEHLMVPARAKDFVTHDLAGFGAAITEFRAQLGDAPR